jgi:transposase
MGQRRSYKQYPEEFKEEAVGLVLEQGYSVPEAAKSLGIAGSKALKIKSRVW